MNVLKVHTLPSGNPDSFRTYWTNSLLRVRGVVETRITRDMPDKRIAAELASLQHLLEVREVLGQNLVGTAAIRLIVSCGAIRKLKLRQSDKAYLAPYASFLTTRFAGCPVTVDKDTRWLDGYQPSAVEHLVVDEPRLETLSVNGVGRVGVTRHVLERIASRLLPGTPPERVAQAAWKKLYELVSDPSLRDVSRTSLWANISHGRNEKHEGRYFLNERHNLMLVITDNAGEGLRLVTAYRATRPFLRGAMESRPPRSVHKW